MYLTVKKIANEKQTAVIDLNEYKLRIRLSAILRICLKTDLFSQRFLNFNEFVDTVVHIPGK